MRPAHRSESLAIALLGVLLTGPARAQTKPRDDAGPSLTRRRDPWTDRPTTISGGGASGGPVGIVGATVEHGLRRWFVVGAGAGYQPGGGTFAVWPRLRLPIGPVAFGIGVPFALGPYRWTGAWAPSEGCSGPDCPFSVIRRWNMAAWFHLEPSVEFRLPQATVLRLYVGRSQMLNRTADECESSNLGACRSNGGESIWYGGITAGYAF